MQASINGSDADLSTISGTVINGTFVNGTFVSGTPIAGSALVLPAVCFMDNTTWANFGDKTSQSHLGLAEYCVLAVFYAFAVTLSALHTHWFKKGKTSTKGRKFNAMRVTYILRICLSAVGFVAAMSHCSPSAFPALDARLWLVW
jgi:hypothetical protein